LKAELAAVRDERDEAQRKLDARTEDVAFLERATLPELRREIQHHQDGKKRWRDRAEKAEARLNAAALVKTWTNEDGKKFVFVEDIAPALLGTTPGTEVAR
jgi:hypothetical protein